MEPLFNAEELEENEKKIRALAQLLDSSEAILMVGAGSSASLYPDWAGFILMLQEEAIRHTAGFSLYDSNTKDFLEYADEVKNCIGKERFHNIIYQHFKPGDKTHEKFHEVLCSFMVQGKLKGITTTNYDVVLESALTSITGKHNDSVRIDERTAPAMIFEFLYSLNKGKVPKRVFHLHGVYHEPDSLILCGSEYEQKYGFTINKVSSDTLFQAIQNGVTEEELRQYLINFGYNWTKHRKILWSLFATRRLIFIGFSLTDPYFRKMLESVSTDLHTYGYENHFLILRVKDQPEKERALIRAKELKNDYGIETVFFEENERNEGLSNFVYELENRLTRSSASEDIIIEKQISVLVEEVQDEDDELTQRLIAISKRK